MKAVFRKRGASLVIVDEDGLEALRTVPDGRDVVVEFKHSRNPRHHRLYWSAIKFIQMHCTRFEGVPLDKIHVALKLATGLVDTFVDAETGKACYVPRSIAWEVMDQSAFNSFFDEAVKIIANRWLPAGSTPESVRNELLLMTDGPHAVQERASCDG